MVKSKDKINILTLEVLLKFKFINISHGSTCYGKIFSLNPNDRRQIEKGFIFLLVIRNIRRFDYLNYLLDVKTL